jgi:hypothetical protein
VAASEPTHTTVVLGGRSMLPTSWGGVWWCAAFDMFVGCIIGVV